MSKPAEAIQEVEKTEFTLEEAAEYLSKSTRTVERLGLSYTLQWRKDKKGNDREIRIFSKAVLDEAKSPKKNDSIKHIPAIMKAEQSPVTQEDLRNFATMLIGGIQTEMKQLAPAPTKPKKTIADVKDKGILNFKEALLWGLTREDLTNALNNGEIKGVCTEKKAVIKGKEVTQHIWKINRHSLDEFCKNYGS